MNRFKAAWLALMGRDPGTAVAPRIASAASALEAAAQTAPAVTAEETSLHAALRRLAKIYPLTFEDVKDGKVMFCKTETAWHEDAPLEAVKVPALYDVFREDRALIQEMKEQGMREIFIDGDLRFLVFSPFGDFQAQKPVDRPGVEVAIGGIPGYYCVKEKQPIDFILGVYDETLAEIEKAMRAGTALADPGAKALAAPAL